MLDFLLRIVGVTALICDLVLLPLSSDWRWARLALLSVGLVMGGCWLRALVRRNSNGFGDRLQLTVVTLWFFFVALESTFLFVAKSHFNGWTLATQNWAERYWPPPNQLGFRGKDFSETELRGKATKKIFIVGDSFVAGHGIENDSDRFTEQLASRIGENFTVVNLGRNGADSSAELRRLRKVPFDPDLLVLSYFPNDAEIAAERCGTKRIDFSPYNQMSRIPRHLVASLYSLNYFFWLVPHSDREVYRQYMAQTYENDCTWRTHTADLAGFVAYARERKIALFVVMFPFLNAVEMTTGILDRVEKFFLQRERVAVLRVDRWLEEIPMERRLVNSSDPHPSVELHASVARRIEAKLRAWPETASWFGGATNETVGQAVSTVPFVARRD